MRCIPAGPGNPEQERGCASARKVLRGTSHRLLHTAKAGSACWAGWSPTFFGKKRSHETTRGKADSSPSASLRVGMTTVDSCREPLLMAGGKDVLSDGHCGDFIVVHCRDSEAQDG